MKILGFLITILGAFSTVLVVLEFIFKLHIVVDDILIETIIGSLTFLVGGILLIVCSSSKKRKSTHEK